jgi:hypothetical protein
VLDQGGKANIWGVAGHRSITLEREGSNSVRKNDLEKTP